MKELPLKIHGEEKFKFTAHDIQRGVRISNNTDFYNSFEWLIYGKNPLQFSMVLPIFKV